MSDLSALLLDLLSDQQSSGERSSGEPLVCLETNKSKDIKFEIIGIYRII